MKYGDFSSLVQLGVGLNIGTALLQLYGEIGLQPLIRTIARINSVVDDNNSTHKDIAEELADLESKFDIFKIRLFNDYKLLIFVNSVCAVLLVASLVFISYSAENTISHPMALVLVSLSVLPAPITLGVLWRNARTEMSPLKKQADALELKAMRRRPMQ